MYYLYIYNPRATPRERGERDAERERGERDTMSNAVVSLAEKRPNFGCDDMREKRLKIGDLPTAMKLQSVGEGFRQYCMICKCNTDHHEFECPDRSKGMGMACSICSEPCEIKDHKDKWQLIFKFCVRCGGRGKHWSKDCPDPIYDDCDFDDVDEDWF